MSNITLDDLIQKKEEIISKMRSCECDNSVGYTIEDLEKQYRDVQEEMDNYVEQSKN